MEKQLIYSALKDVMSKVGAIGKNRRNEEQKYNFRGIDDVMTELHNLFAEAGIIVLTDVLESSRMEHPTKSGGTKQQAILKVKFTFVAEDGSSVSATTEGEGMDSGDKATNKAMSAALKYALIFLLLIPTAEKKDSEEDNHNDLVPKKVYSRTPAPANVAAAPPEPKINPVQQAELLRLLDEVSTPEEKNKMVLNMPKMTEARAAVAIDNLKKKLAEKLEKEQPTEVQEFENLKN